MSERKVILKMVLSLDGFATSPDGTHEWMFEWFGEDSSERNLRALQEAGVHAMGRRSYEIMGPHWAASEGPIATAMNDKPKAVFSHSLEKTDWGPAEIDRNLSLTELQSGLMLDDARVDALVAFLETLTDRRYEPLLAERKRDAAD